MESRFDPGEWWAAEQPFRAALDGRKMPADDPVRRRIEAATDREAARPYRPLSADDRAELPVELRSL